jgi:hypothetical protein
MPCEDEVIVESTSPKGPHSVRVLVRNCGATTPYVTLVQARTSGLLSGWTDIAQAIGRPVMELRWSSVKTAVVAYGMCAPGKVDAVAGGINGLSVELLNDHALESQCGTNGYWEPQLSKPSSEWERSNNKMQLTSGGLLARFARVHQVAACS